MVNGAVRGAVAAPFLPKLAVSAVGAMGVKADATASTDGWPITDYNFDFGDGSAVNGSSAVDTDHQYAKPGTYAVTVTETDQAGHTATATEQFTTVGSGYTPMSPVRILDTRKGIGAPASAVPAFGTLRLKIAGVAGVPASGVRAVALNLTVVNPTQGGYITAYPGDETKPTVSNLNFTPGEAIPNTVIVQVGADGYVNLANGSGGTVDLVADLAGYYSAASPDTYNALVSTRVLDTRTGSTTLPANGVAKVYLGAFVPPGGGGKVMAAALNITVTNPKQGGYITAYPDDTTRPVVSNVNFRPGQTVANGAMVEVGADGYVDFVNGSGGSTDLIVDANGSFTTGAGAAFVAMTPTRVLDTRHSARIAADGVFDLELGYGSGAPAPLTVASAIAGNFTVTNPAAGGYLTVYPDDSVSGPPLASLMNFAAQQTLANAGTIALGSRAPGQRGVDIFNGSGGPADVIVDVFGYYSTM